MTMSVRSYLRVDDDRLVDDDLLGRNVLRERSAGARRRLGDLVDHVHPFDDLAEHRVAVALRIRRAEVQELVVGDVDEELRGRRVGIAGARHGERAGHVHAARPCSIARTRSRSAASSGFCLKSGVKPPPWTMKPGITRWNCVPS